MAIAARRLVRLIVVVGAAACAEQRPAVARDSSAAPVQVSPVAAFLASRGRTWELARVDSSDLPPTHAGSATRGPTWHPGAGVRPTIRFTAEPVPDVPRDSAHFRAGGSSFCNGYGTTYSVGPGDQLRFHTWGSTLVGCNGPDSLESRLFRGLGATRRFALASDTLVLIADDGSRITFVAATDSTRPPPR